MKKAGIRDVALHAGVSTATVSHVLNKTRYVSPETTALVMESIKALNYSPNEAGRSLKTGKKKLVGFITPDITNEYYSLIFDHLEKVVKEEGYHVVIANTKETVALELEHIVNLSSGIVDGIVLASTADDYQPIIKSIPDGYPLVCVDRSIPNCPFSSVTVSSYDSMYQGVTHLIKRGHSNIAFVGGIKRLSTVIERTEAYKAALRDAGLPVIPDHIQYLDTLEKGADGWKNYFTDPSNPCTAIVAINSMTATDIVLYQIENSAVLKKKMEILGWDEGHRNNFALKYMNYITQPAASVGKTAGKQIIKKKKNPGQAIRQTILTSTFYPRIN